MSRLVIGNRLAGSDPHRAVWFAQVGDVVVLPSHPGGAFLDRVRRVNALPAGEPRIAVPPPGRRGAGSLDHDRLAAPGFVGELRTLVRELRVDRLLAVRCDAAVLRLAREVGLDGPGVGGFAAELGGGLVDNVAVFRAVAAGNGVPVPDGRVCADPEAALDFAWPVLAGGQSALVRVHQQAATGDELIVPVGGGLGDGGYLTIAVGDRETLGEYLDKNWERYSRDGALPVVVEHHIRDCGRLRVEFSVGDDDVEVLWYGRALGYGREPTAPIRGGIVIPPRAEDVPDLGGFVAQASRAMGIVRGLGYRGHAGLDVVVTPAGRVQFCAASGGWDGFSHVDVIARHAVGADYLHTRVLMVREHVSWPSYAEAGALLDEHGLAFDPDGRTGVLPTADGGPSGQLLVVGHDHAHAADLEARALAALSPAERSGG